VLGEPHKSNLRSLWNVADERSYFPIKGIHYSDQTAVAEFAGIHITSEELGMAVLREWRPEVDIKIAAQDTGH
jgi:hypothetical protein